MDKLRAMATFVRIVETGSLTAAADALEVSGPSVVRLLASLERSLDVRLLNRTTRRIALTDEGRDYFERCKRILAEVEEAEAAAGNRRGAARGELRVTAPALFGRMHVAPLAAEFGVARDELGCERRDPGGRGAPSGVREPEVPCARRDAEDPPGVAHARVHPLRRPGRPARVDVPGAGAKARGSGPRAARRQPGRRPRGSVRRRPRHRHVPLVSGRAARRGRSPEALARRLLAVGRAGERRLPAR